MGCGLCGVFPRHEVVLVFSAGEVFKNRNAVSLLTPFFHSMSVLSPLVTKSLLLFSLLHASENSPPQSAQRAEPSSANERDRVLRNEILPLSTPPYARNKP